MFAKIKQSPWMGIILSLMSLVFGLVVSPLLERIIAPAFSSETRALLAGFFVICVLTILLAAAIGFYTSRNDHNRSDLIREIDEINSKLGLSVTFIKDLPRQEATGQVLKRATDIVSKAEKSIWVLGFWRGNYGETMRSEAYTKARNEYENALLNKLQVHKHDVLFYRRIMQFPDGPYKDGIPEEKVEVMSKHLRNVLKFTKQYQESAVLKQSATYLQQTFVLVDDRYVLWEIDAEDPDTGLSYIDGMLVFEDVDGTFIDYIKKFFQKVEAHSTMVKQLVSKTTK